MTNPANDPAVLDAIGQAERIGDRATADLIRREAKAASTRTRTDADPKCCPPGTCPDER